MEECTTDRIRGKWLDALQKLKTESISTHLEWCFTYQDLLVLGGLHQAGMHTEKITDLLTDCNFHTECQMLKAGKYTEYFMEVMKDEKPLF